MRKALVLLFFMSFAATALFAIDTLLSDLGAFDRDHDGRLDQAELTDYLVVHNDDVSGDRKKAGDLAVDLLTKNPCVSCKSILISDLAAIVPTSKPKPPTPASRPCHFFGFSRTLTDDIDPRRSESEVPAVAAYHHDKHAEKDHDWFDFQGSADVVKCALNGGDRATLPDTYGIKFGIEFDVDGTKKKNENSIDFGVPFSWEHVRSANATLTDIEIDVAPTFSTDRGFDRRVYELGVDFIPRIPSIGAGMLTWLSVDTSGDPRLTFFWRPTVSFEFADIADAAGNEDLLALKRRTSRVALKAQATFRPKAWVDRLAFSVKAAERWNLEGNVRRWYVEPSMTYDLTADGGVGLTAMYQHGRKPPAFSAKDVWLIGIGIKR
jgi:hypothetical protein